MEQFTRHLLYIWHCRLTHNEVPCVIPLVRTGVQNKRSLFSQVRQLTNMGPSSEHWQGNSDTMLRANYSTILLPAVTHPPQATKGPAPQELFTLTMKGIQRSGPHQTWG